MTIATRYRYDSAEDKDIIHRVQDCEPILDEVKAIKDVSDGRSDTSLGYFVGRIPSIIVEQYLQEAGITFGEFIKDDIHVKRIFNDPDYSKFKVFEGRV